MNEYRWADLRIGLKHDFTATFSAADAIAFANLSGDVNPLHTDAAYAEAAGFPRPVLFGRMTSSLYSPLVGVYLPGRYALLQGINIDFNTPCFAGEVVSVTGEIVFMIGAYHRFEIKATIRKQDRKLVSKATIRVGFTSVESMLITGASSETGCSLVRRLLQTSNASTVLAHFNRSGDKLPALKGEFGNRLHLLKADFSDSSSVEMMVERISKEHGTPTSIVHLRALRLINERFTKFQWGRFDKDLAVQVRSAVILLSNFLPNMAKLTRGRVLFVLSSVVCGVPPKYMTMYTTLKYTQLGLMRSLAAEYAFTSVRINAISPSMVETQFLSEISEIAV